MLQFPLQKLLNFHLNFQKYYYNLVVYYYVVYDVVGITFECNKDVCSGKLTVGIKVISFVVTVLYHNTITVKVIDISTDYLTSRDADFVFFARNTYSLDYTVVRCDLSGT